MAFNLNKNDATNPSTKFDLSKGSSLTEIGTEREKSKSKTWLFSLLGLLVIGIAAWYFLAGSNDASKNENGTIATAIGLDSADILPATQNNAVNAPVKAENENASAASPNGDTKPSNNGSTSLTTAIPGTGINNRVPATFAKGSNSISGLDAALVKDIISYLEKNPGTAINVNGYASSEGALTVNQKISQSRADTFKRYLISRGVPFNRIKATGKGIDNPISSNDTEEGRIKNRRVDISLQ